MTYSVSYRKTWRRRRYACGYVSKSEAEECYHRLVSIGYPRVKIEKDAQSQDTKENSS